MDQPVNSGALVVLDGSQSIDADGSIVAYQWVQTAGIPVGELANANTSHAGFTAPAVGSGVAILSFRLTVTDDLGVQSNLTGFFGRSAIYEFLFIDDKIRSLFFRSHRPAK